MEIQSSYLEQERQKRYTALRMKSPSHLSSSYLKDKQQYEYTHSPLRIKPDLLQQLHQSRSQYDYGQLDSYHSLRGNQPKYRDQQFSQNSEYTFQLPPQPRKTMQDEAIQSDLQNLNKSPAFTLEQPKIQIDNEDELSKAYLNLLETYQKKQGLEDQERQKQYNLSKIRIHSVDSDYMKWTDTFSRKTVLWDEQLQDIPQRQESLERTSQFHECYRMKQDSPQKASLSRQGSSNKKQRLHSSKLSQKLKKVTTLETPAKTGCRHHQDLQFSDKQSTADTKKSQKGKKKLSKEELKDLAKKISEIAKKSQYKNQSVIKYQNKEIPIQEFIKLCNKHYEKCNKFSNEIEDNIKY